MLLSTAGFDQPEGVKFNNTQNVETDIKIELMILMVRPSLKTNHRHFFAKQIKIFIRKIKGEVRIPPAVAASTTAVSSRFSTILVSKESKDLTKNFTPSSKTCLIMASRSW
jgi:hypothetical protein